MAAPFTTVYYTVSPHTGVEPSVDELCQFTYVVVVYTDTGGNPNLVSASYAQGLFNLWNDYVSLASVIDITTLPDAVQAWLTQFSYDPTSFTVYA